MSKVSGCLSVDSTGVSAGRRHGARRRARICVASHSEHGETRCVDQGVDGREDSRGTSVRGAVRAVAAGPFVWFEPADRHATPAGVSHLLVRRNGACSGLADDHEINERARLSSIKQSCAANFRADVKLTHSPTAGHGACVQGRALPPASRPRCRLAPRLRLVRPSAPQCARCAPSRPCPAVPHSARSRGYHRAACVCTCYSAQAAQLAHHGAQIALWYFGLRRSRTSHKSQHCGPS